MKIRSISPVSSKLNVQVCIEFEDGDEKYYDYPLLAWAVVYKNEEEGDSIEPMFLDDGSHPVVFSQYELEACTLRGWSDTSYQIEDASE